MEGDEQSMHVIDRQDVKQHISWHESQAAWRVNAFDVKLLWVIIAPLERPVVPDV